MPIFGQNYLFFSPSLSSSNCLQSSRLFDYNVAICISLLCQHQQNIAIGLQCLNTIIFNCHFQLGGCLLISSLLFIRLIFHSPFFLPPPANNNTSFFPLTFRSAITRPWKTMCNNLRHQFKAQSKDLIIFFFVYSPS